MRRTWHWRPAPRGESALAPSAIPAILAAGVTLAVGATTVAGCSSRPAGVALRANSAAVAAAATASASPVPLSVRQQVIDAITGYTVALGAADRSRDPAAARRLLQPYLAASRVDGMIQTMRSIWAKGEVFYGQDVLHVLRVTIHGRSAVVHDCDDTSGMGLEIAASGQVVQGSAGVPDENIVTTLKETAGRWLVQFQLIEDVPCTA